MARLILGLVVVLAAGSASAINVVTVFENSGFFPSVDPDGSKMQTMMGHMETYIEDIFEAPWTLTVYYSYMEGGFGAHQNRTTSGGKPTSCGIALSAAYGWWFDPTPLDDSEFNMVPRRASEFTSTDLATWYNGNVPDLLEVQCQGSTKTSAPAEAKNNFDAWTVLMHEMGHGLGMTGAVASGEYADLDYDFDPQLVWGNTMAANCGAADNRVHLAAPALMHGGEIRGRRKILSATDILAIETTCNWGDTTIDLLRKDFYSASANAAWNTGGNWAGNRMPDSHDAAVIRHGGTAVLTSDASVASLTVDAGSSLAISREGSLTAGTLTLKHGVSTVMELGGLDPGVNSAWIRVTGTAVLDGTLDLRLAAGYQPMVGDTFELFDFDGAYAGYFDQVLVPDHYEFDLTHLTTDGSINVLHVGVPIALDDQYSLDEDSLMIKYNYEGVLINDVDPDPATAMEAVLVAETSHGTVTLYSSGALKYTPEPDYHGTDSFTYVARDDDADSNPAMVTLNIASVNDAPIAVDDVYEIEQDGTLIVYSYEGVLTNDVDPDNEDNDPDNDVALQALRLSDPSHGAFQWYSGGAFKYTPATGYFGTDSFTYLAYDGEAYSELGTVLIRVLGAIQTQIAGDANGDGAVNETDAAILADHWGDSGADWSMGDFNGDGSVNAADASILAANWGAVAESSTAAVPEPATLALLLAATLALVSRRRRPRASCSGSHWRDASGTRAADSYP